MSRPLVSFCLLSYNQEDYIAEAIESALQQDYSNLEIIISDDNSKDSSVDIIKKTLSNYKGRHKIITNFNTKNLGLAAHINLILYKISKGEFLFLAAGDDISRIDRVSYSMNYFKNPEIVALGSCIQEINHQSIEIDTKEFYCIEQNKIYNLKHYLSPDYRHIYGPTRAISRKLINAFPPLNPKCPTEDTPLLLRAFLFGKVAMLNEKLVQYRVHDSNMSSPTNLKKIPRKFIYDQYKKDVKFALGKYINKNEYQSLTRHFKLKSEGIKGNSLNNYKTKILSIIKSFGSSIEIVNNQNKSQSD